VANVAAQQLVTRQRRKRVTLADVAAKAGVSVATASVAITGRPSGNCRVSAEVAEKIRAAARELNYRPNIQARSLSTQRSHTVAMLIKRASWHNAIFYVSAMQRTLRAHGYTDTFILHPDNALETEREHIELCVQRRVEGIILIPVIDLDRRSNVDLINQVHRDEEIPLVQLGIALPGCAAPSVIGDDVEGIRGAVRLLHAMGHRRIAHLTIPGYDDPDPLNPYKQAHLRCLGYRRGMAELGLAEQLFCTPGDFSNIQHLFDAAYPFARAIAECDPRPTAVIAFADYAAAGLIAGLKDIGLAVPEDISVLGVGDQPFGRMLCPALSTLAPAFDRLGELATQTLLDMVDGAPGQSAAIPPSLLMRNSVRAVNES
jgi:LacI family transcriptional regulator